jgi:hypothetical protein
MFKDISFFVEIEPEINSPDLGNFDEIYRVSRELEKEYFYQRLEIYPIQVVTSRLFSIFPRQPGIQSGLASTEAPHLQGYTPPYLAFMLHACQQLGLSADRRVTKQEVEAWIREHWPPALGQSSNSKVEYMSTFLRHPEDQKGGHYRPTRKT